MKTPLTRSIPVALVAASLALAALSGCATRASSTGTPSPNPASSATSSSSTTPSESTTPSASASTTPSAGAPATCAAADLAGEVQNQAGGGAAGSVVVGLVLTNTSGSPCVLHGVPGVSYVGHGNGTQLGAAADRTGMASAPVITLAPGASATALLKETHAENYADCTQVPADGLRVYPPGATDALFIPQSTTACTESNIVLLSVKAFQPE